MIDVAVINPLCSSNIDSHISEGFGGAAAAYGRYKESLHHDLDLNTYEFLPFIMETTGGLSKAAAEFCKEIKKQYESSKWYGDSECPWNYEINTLQSAINVELQKANSRMILERTPRSEDLIEKDIVKCELAVVKKREKAIETLRLERLRPRRFIESIKTGVGNIQPKKGVKWKSVNIPRPYPLNPKPPWKDKNDKDVIPGIESGVTMEWECEAEERILATKLNTSQTSSTFVFSERLSTTFTSSEKREIKPGGLSKDVKVNTDNNVEAGRNKIDSERKDTEKAHWEPPCAKNMRTE